jgi:hypothetical protein
MRLNRNVKVILQANAEYRLERLKDADNLSLKELIEISQQSEKDLIQYVMSLPERKFDKLMAVIGPRWREYTAMRLRNRKRMQELCDRDQVSEQVNGHH